MPSAPIAGDDNTAPPVLKLQSRVPGGRGGVLDGVTTIVRRGFFDDADGLELGQVIIRSAVITTVMEKIIAKPIFQFLLQCLSLKNLETLAESLSCNEVGRIEEAVITGWSSDVFCSRAARLAKVD